jgi:transposase
MTSWSTRRAARNSRHADKLSAHKTKQVAAFLAEHPKVHMHFKPTYWSWLNQVDLGFPRLNVV